jgi:RHS repeat-associated protein
MIDSSGGTAVTYYVAAGRLEEPQQLIDGSGTVTWNAYVTPWGAAQTFATPTETTDLRLPGQWTQAETGGLSQNHFRDYSPTTGRYVEADPIGLAGGTKLYAYVGGDPLNAIDPNGEAPRSRPSWCPNCGAPHGGVRGVLCPDCWTKDKNKASSVPSPLVLNQAPNRIRSPRQTIHRCRRRKRHSHGGFYFCR